MMVSQAQYSTGISLALVLVVSSSWQLVTVSATAAAVSAACQQRSACLQQSAHKLQQCANDLAQLDKYYQAHPTLTSDCELRSLAMDVRDAYLEQHRVQQQAACVMRATAFSSPCQGNLDPPPMDYSQIAPITSQSAADALETQAWQLCDRAFLAEDNCGDSTQECDVDDFCTTCYELSPLHQSQHQLIMHQIRLAYVGQCASLNLYDTARTTRRLQWHLEQTARSLRIMRAHHN